MTQNYSPRRNNSLRLLKQRLQRLRNSLWRVRFWSWLRAKPAPVATPPAPPDRMKQAFEELEQKYRHVKEDILIPELQENRRHTNKFMLESGWRDSSVGVKSNHIEKIARTQAVGLYDQARFILKGRLAEMNAGLEAKERIKEQDEFNNQEQSDYYKYREFGYRYYPRSYSLTLFFIYFASFLVLFVADIPLALRLIQNGFDLGSNPELPIENIFSGDVFWVTVLSNWELILTALGIAFCSVYIKVIYDDLIGTSFASKFVSKRNFNDLFTSKVEKAGNDKGLTEEDFYHIYKSEKGKKNFKTFIAFFTLVALVILAIFRIQVLKNDTAEPPKWIGAAVVVITVLFPVMAGICLSLAFTCLQNRTRFWIAKSDCKRYKKKFISSLNDYSEYKKKCDVLEYQLNDWQDWERHIKNTEEMLVAYYHYGCDIGLSEPDKFMKGDDFFRKVSNWRERAVAQKINRNVTNTSS